MVPSPSPVHTERHRYPSGDVDFCHVYRCAGCDREVWEFQVVEVWVRDAGVVVVPACTTCEDEHYDAQLVPWAHDRAGVPLPGDTLDDEACPECLQPTCDCGHTIPVMRERAEHEEPAGNFRGLG